MLVNFSNHPYEKWEDRQKEAARVYGTTRDLKFPAVPGNADEKDIDTMAERSVEEILALLGGGEPDAVLVQGEFTLTYAVVSRLLDRGISVISASADRRVTETRDDEGRNVKQAVFCFDRFREYRKVNGKVEI